MINVAKTAGFCYGVKRAVDDVCKEIENGKKIATLGPLIHNRQVIEIWRARACMRMTV